jgi:pimeloyl-ACP methyl ester carboxylesterase/DNA-binding winged helix-turn-helix (wHTH) protein
MRAQTNQEQRQVRLPMAYAFDRYELDPDRFELRRDGVRVDLEPQVLDVLRHLVEHRDRVVPRTELLDTVWGDRFVSDAALSSRIKAARRAVGDDGASQRVIRTIHGRGYRFVAEVTGPGAAGPAPVGAGGAVPAQEVRFCTATDGVRLAFASAGSGPPLLKAANWLTHLRHDWESIVWGHWLRDLSAHHRFVHYDLRGTGLSQWEVDDVGFDAWVADLETVADAAGLHRFPLLGISQGGAVAVAYAARHPERVSHLVLYGAFPLGRMARARTERERREARTMLEVVANGWADDTSMFRLLFAAQFMPEGSPEQWDAFDAHQRLTASPETATRLLTTSAGIDVTALAPLVRAPTLVLHARDDRRVPVEQGRLLASLIPGARFVELPSRNHLLLDGEAAWTAFLDATEAFLAG